jgi:hypothetical protein
MYLVFAYNRNNFDSSFDNLVTKQYKLSCIFGKPMYLIYREYVIKEKSVIAMIIRKQKIQEFFNLQ